MSYSFSNSETQTFTITHARHLAAKVATDLKRMQRFYGSPSDNDIDAFENELIALLKAGYLGEVTYGFRRNGNFIEPSLKYTAKELTGANALDEDPGKIRPGVDVQRAQFGSFLQYSKKWNELSESERQNFKNQLPIKRTSGLTPGIEGYYAQDKIYSSGGQSLNRSSLKPFQS